ncbi:MAG TPA: hypothetical protein VHZ09_03685 [Acidobacteriaceae bacterium]|jgi:hypothetical protein|nr:hypothetical protein [Acidobacteriaceae bacterium]
MSAQNPSITGETQKPSSAEVFLVYPSWTMKYALTTLANLLLLLVGVTIGLLLAPKLEKRVSAQAEPAASTVAPTCVSSATVECLTPIMTVGSAGIGKLLSNQIAADRLTVNGYDLLKLDNNIISVFIQAHILTQDQAKALAEASLADKQLRYQPPAPPPAAAVAPKK